MSCSSCATCPCCHCCCACLRLLCHTLAAPAWLMMSAAAAMYSAKEGEKSKYLQHTAQDPLLFRLLCVDKQSRLPPLLRNALRWPLQWSTRSGCLCCQSLSQTWLHTTSPGCTRLQQLSVCVDPPLEPSIVSQRWTHCTFRPLGNSAVVLPACTRWQGLYSPAPFCMTSCV